MRKTIEQDLADDPYAQAAFSELLKKAIQEAADLFDHPYKQYVLMKDLEEQLKKGQAPGIPDKIANNRHQRAYFGALLQNLPEDVRSTMTEERIIEDAIMIDSVVKSAVATHSLDPENAISEIRKMLLPRYFNLSGNDMNRTNPILDSILEIVRRGAGRDDS